MRLDIRCLRLRTKLVSLCSRAHYHTINYNSAELDKRWLNEIQAPQIDAPNAEKVFMLLAPPNITGALHLGHALNGAIQDAHCRYLRLKGKQPVWIPGFDHAGIGAVLAVQKAQSDALHNDPTRLLSADVAKWSQSTMATMRSQLKSLGFCLDWQRAYFTMDDAFSQFVRDAFVQLWDSGLIYRDSRFVNWSPWLQTCVADVEAESRTFRSPTALTLPSGTRVVFGQTFKMRFDEAIVVHTTRPETCFGDVGIAVHPNDTRYANFVGRSLRHPITCRQVPVIADNRIDPSVGSGAMKLTPAHSPFDHSIARDHGLLEAAVECIDDAGRVSCPDFPAYHGKDRFEVRAAVAADYSMPAIACTSTVHFCVKSGDVIEHKLKPQWFLRASAFKQQMQNALHTAPLSLAPSPYCRMWKRHAETLQDWCISRQIAWGHRLPLFHVGGNTKRVVVAANSHADALKRASAIDATVGSDAPCAEERDVLDAWFSSALVPHFVRAPKIGPMITGHDILFFWLFRIVLLSLALKKHIPFSQAFLHSLIRDAAGRKMSKLAGNSIDPLKLLTDTQIAQTKGAAVGIDALRYSLLSHSTNELFINYDVQRIKAGSAMCVKLLNLQNFAFVACPVASHHSDSDDRALVSASGPFEWRLLAEFNAMLAAYEAAFALGHVFKALDAIRTFVFDELSGRYVPYIKAVTQQAAMPPSAAMNRCFLRVLQKTAALTAPFLPVVAHEMFERWREAQHRNPLTEFSAGTIYDAKHATPFDLRDADAAVIAAARYFYSKVQAARSSTPSKKRSVDKHTSQETAAFCTNFVRQNQLLFDALCK